MEEKTEIEEMDDTAYYKNLDKKGFVARTFNDPTIANFMSFRGLFRKVFMAERKRLDETFFANDDEEDFERFLNFSMVKVDGGLFLSDDKYSRKSMYITLSGHIARIFKAEFQRSAFRTKETLDSEDIVKGMSGIRNVYPQHYIEHIYAFLQQYPLKVWHLSKNKK